MSDKPMSDKPIAVIHRHYNRSGERILETVQLAVSIACANDQHQECNGFHRREAEVAGECDPRCPCACHFGRNLNPKPA